MRIEEELKDVCVYPDGEQYDAPPTWKSDDYEKRPLRRAFRLLQMRHNRMVPLNRIVCSMRNVALKTVLASMVYILGQPTEPKKTPVRVRKQWYAVESPEVKRMTAEHEQRRKRKERTE
jgi:hypothetical protein